MAAILVVDDEDILRNTLKRALNRDEMTVTTASSAKEGLELLKTTAFDLIITDVKMPEMDGLKFLRKVKAKDSELPVIVLTGFATVEMTKDALQHGAFNFITKPFDVENILSIVKKGLDLKKKIVTNREIAAFTKSAFDIEIPSRSDLLGGVIFYILEQLKLMDFSHQVIASDILMTLDESLTNANKHGNKGDAQKKIFIHTQIDSEKMEITIRDEGDGFSPDKLVDPLSSEGIERNCGRGVFLMKGYMDEVKFNDKGNEVNMVKHNRR